jgi:hypothetical protein
MEVMGLMLGEFVDEYTVKVVDVFAMPQSGTGVSVEAVDPVFQTKMLDMLKQTGRSLPAFRMASPPWSIQIGISAAQLICVKCGVSRPFRALCIVVIVR